MIATGSVPDRGRAFRDRIVRPILIVSTPRSGSTLLFETLVQAPEVFSTGRESHMRIEQVADFHPARRGWTSNRLDSSDAAPSSIEELAQSFYSVLRDRDGRAALGNVRMLEKTPKNALRVPFFNAGWNDSVFVYLYRDVRQTLASMIEAWLSRRFVTYPRLPDWSGPPWSLLLVPGWRDLIGRPLAEIVARQWATTTDVLVDDLSHVAPERVIAIDYEELSADPQTTMLRLTRRLDLEWDVQLDSNLPLSQYTYTPPSPDKWRKFGAEIEAVRPLVERADESARALLKARRF
jgi:LPS sulfotransferase NodH